MIDFRVVSAKVVLQIDQVAPIRNFLPPSIVVLGQGLDKTSEVVYNDHQATEFFVQSPTRMIVRIPPAVVGKPFQYVKALSTTYLSKRDAELSLKLNNPLQSLKGMDRLIQNWVMTFMTTPGSDVFDKNSGGGGRSLIGKQTDRDGRGVSADLTMAIDRTRAELLKKQNTSSRIPPDEKLLSSEMGQVVFDPSSGTLTAKVYIKNLLGNSAEVSLG